MRRWLRILARDLRGWHGRLPILIGCLGVGVAAVVAVASLGSGVRQEVRSEARRLLAADLVVSGRRPAPEPVRAKLDELRGEGRVDVAEVAELASMAATPSGQSLLVVIKAAEPGYPFHGTLDTAPAGLTPARLDDRSALVAPDLLERLAAAVGDELLLGGQPFRIVGTVSSEPDRPLNLFSLGPRVLITRAGLDRTTLTSTGSRVTWRSLVRVLPAGPDVDALALAVRDALDGSPFHELETWREAQPTMRRSFERAERFLGLVALLSLVVGGVGVARTIQAWIAGKTRAIAVMKCLGMRPAEVVALHLAEVVVVALAASVLGALVGVALAAVAPALLAGTLPVEDWQVIQPAAIARGLALGLGVAVLFAIAPLVDVRRLPPGRVLRADAEALPQRRLVRVVLAAVLFVGLSVLAAAQSGDLLLGTGFAAGMLVVTLVLGGGATLLHRVSARLPRARLPWVLRHGVAALARPASGVTSALVALGTGVLAVSAVAIVERQLREQLTASLPVGSPTAFLVDIQPDQWDDVRRTLEEGGAERVDSVPMVIARLGKIDGRPVADIAESLSEEERELEWALTREQRLTWLAELPEDNRIVAGEHWSDPDRAELSIEVEYAEELGLEVGSVVELDVQGVPVELTVTSLREVDWSTYRINFFLIVEPGVLDKAPHARLASAHLDPAALSAVQQSIVSAHPNITIVDIRTVLQKVSGVLGFIGLGVRLLGSFTVLAGLAILAGVVSAGSLRRGREVALLKTLGATRGQVVSALLVEHGLVGLVAGAIGIGGASVLAWAVLTHGLEMEAGFSAGVTAAVLVLTPALAALVGALASAGALARRPLEAIRRE